jgi:chemotaxis protein MotB
MSNGKIDVPSPPVVIVRRKRGPLDEEHHGGVWKIAYADFMTAMMAFFLVMWLVNAADKKTITQVAAYFNPVRLTDRVPSTKGLEDPTEDEHQKQAKAKGENKGNVKSKAVNKDVVEKTTGDEEQEDLADLDATRTSNVESKTIGGAERESQLFSNPMGLLDKLAKEAKASANAKIEPRGDDTEIRDPFDPSQRLEKSASKPQAKPVKEEPGALPPQALPPSGRETVANDVKSATNPAVAKMVEKEIRDLLAGPPNVGPNIEVKATSEGLLVSLVDDAKFGMFEVGSAQPRPEVILTMQKIATVLKSKTGRIVVRGHTDGRQYRNGAYDNWRLSSDRAQMSYYMLVRGGIDARRFDAIEGHADRDLNVLADPGAAQNRRIDILLKDDQR